MNVPSPADAPGIAVVIGATGGLGRAFVDALARDPAYSAVLALSRAPLSAAAPGIVTGHLDLTDEGSITAAAAQARTLGEPRLVIVATGILHGAGIAPEKSWNALRADTMAAVFAVNCIGPSMVARHFLPLLPRQGRSVFAALSARVGSIGDNRLGGWHAYRASKAALNMMIRGLSIELARRAPQAMCLGLHPGTVDTSLSAPFQGNVAPGGLFAPADAAARLLAVIAAATPADSGSVLAWDGSTVPP
jgi:NAD(P)-dependent dehydrogenase (short-subunit alcohol dehydrogenase family)